MMVMGKIQRYAEHHENGLFGSRYLRLMGLVVAALMLSIGALYAAESIPDETVQDQQDVGAIETGHALTAEDVSAWLDGHVPLAIQKGGIAGAVVVIVKDGEILAEKGYGYSDVEAKTPVDPAKTLFRPGSVSKLFTWTAVMQLVEQGKIDLDADVNRYLDFEIPPYDGKPLTMHQIMTHTSGFEEYIRGLIMTDPEGVSLDHGIKSWVPNRVFEPGTTPAYSNYATALAGYIVERVSGQTFDDYVDQNIFSPLEMNRSTFRQPLPANLAADMSKGYALPSEGAKPFEIVSLPPAGSMSATGRDMANFMIAHLQDGRFGDKQILRPETAQMMHDTSTRLMAPLNGMRLGFYDQDINGHRVIAHGGDTQWFHSNLLLFLDDGVGVFVSVNSTGVPNANFRQIFFEAFADRYFPAPAGAEEETTATAAEHARMIAGNYVSQRSAFSSFMAASRLIGQISVIANPDDTISLSLLRTPSGELKKYREVQPFVWREVDGHDRIAAIVKDGKVVRISSDMISGIMVLDRVPAYYNAAWLIPAVLGALGALALTVLAWPAAVVLRRIYKHPFTLEGKRKLVYRLVRVFAIAALAAVGSWFALQPMFLGETGYEKLAMIDKMILATQFLTLLGFAGGLLISIWNLVLIWKESGNKRSKFWSVILMLSFGLLTYFGWIGNLYNFSTNY